MAVGTGTGAKTGSLTQEEKEIVEKAGKPVNIMDKIRLFLLFITVLVLLFIYFGGKFFMGNGWFDDTVSVLYYLLSWDVLLIVLVTFLKFMFVVRYNRTVKKL